jgi:hypothetical protein
MRLLLGDAAIGPPPSGYGLGPGSADVCAAGRSRPRAVGEIVALQGDCGRWLEAPPDLEARARPWGRGWPPIEWVLSTRIKGARPTLAFLFNRKIA